jgi:hypothetical protein
MVQVTAAICRNAFSTFIAFRLGQSSQFVLTPAIRNAQFPAKLAAAGPAQPVNGSPANIIRY